MGRQTSKKSKLVNNYKGWPKQSAMPKKVAMIDASIDPEEFWEHFVSQRKPVLLDGHPTDPEWMANRWTVDYLRKKAGKVPVRVEHRSSKSGSYGKGEATKLDMSFGKVLEKLSNGDTSLYMTTQPVSPAPDGHPEITAPPTSNLATDFPIQPSILGNLVPQQVNIWMGCTDPKEGSTTGLHLDFHDNLYVLMYGKKKFRLFPPSMVPQMYCNGTAKIIHPNGRVVFESQGDVLADGSEAHEVKAWKKKRSVEIELEEAEAAVARGEKGAKKRLEAAERAMDSVLEEALEDDAFGDFDDFEALEQMESGAKNNNQDLQIDPEPDSFSKIDLSLSKSTLKKNFPDFLGVEAALTVEMEAGQMLYLPAGWFHEVTSYSSNDDESPGFHLALNYWTHPPDNMDDSPDGFKQPYKSDYWPQLWEQRKARYEALREGTDGEKKRERDVAAVANDHHDHDHHHAADGSCCGGHHHDHDHDHHHHGDHEMELEEYDASQWRAPTVGERVHFLQGVRYAFGIGRRHHLHKFIGLRIRGNVE